MKKLILLTGIALQLSAMSFSQNATIQYSNNELIKLVQYIKSLEQQRDNNLSISQIAPSNNARKQSSPDIIKNDIASYTESEIIALVNYIKSLEKQQNIAKNEPKILAISENKPKMTKISQFLGDTE